HHRAKDRLFCAQRGCTAHTAIDRRCQRASRKSTQGDLEAFLKEVLAAKDRAFLVGFGNHIRLVSDFSHSSPEMMECWKRYEKNTQKVSEIGSPESRDLGTAFYDSFYYPVTEKLAKEEGRKALL